VIRPGDVLVLESGGGGGWSDPALRDLGAVAGDIENGFVTEAAPNPPASRALPSPRIAGRGLG
jgi:N-methylhydantoinase B/oxoprolinase/acetone carboxylase alpha subunit